ncbi:MAG TPA: type II secretion system F family protein [Thermopetrobacter sp.]|nr:type II secretion system F family protein [Thermopetrobacter sp.]
MLALLTIENAIAFVIAALVFLTFATLIIPHFQSEDLRKRMREVALERDKLRARQRAELERNNQARLRDKPKGLLPQIVEALNLRKHFEADTYRHKLRMAGLRQEKHLVTFLAARLFLPFILGIGAYAYATNTMSPDTPAQMRLAAVMLGLVAGFYLPGVYVTNLIKKRQQSIQLAWSDALDLLLICVESGMSIEQAMNKVAREIGSSSIALAEEMLLTTAELSYLGDRKAAYENLSLRTGLPTVKATATALVQAEQYGTPLGQALRVLAQENRNARMMLAEKKAAALPPKLTVPMIVFFLPVIFVVILGPSIIAVMNMNYAPGQ